MKRFNLIFIVFFVFFIFLSAAAWAQEGALPIPQSQSVSEDDSSPFQIPSDVKYFFLTLGIGGAAGWAVGFTTKKLAKIVAVILGLVFISVQYLAYKSYITVDWEKIKAAVPNAQLQDTAGSFLHIVTYNLPFAGSFLLGFWAGFRKG